MATRRIRRLAVAIHERDATRIAGESKGISKVMVYLWALRQFREQGDT